MGLMTGEQLGVFIEGDTLYFVTDVFISFSKHVVNIQIKTVKHPRYVEQLL